ncbi:LOW QUALITY PROTEIN: Aa_trans domain-containing protein, partial [Cephalotus follicularis]
EHNENSASESMRTDLNGWTYNCIWESEWWYSAFRNVTAMVGAGVLGLPFAMSQLRWSAGICAMFGSWMITLYSLCQLVELREVVPGKRFDRYPELGQHAFGKKYGYWFIMPQQMTVQVASDIVYMVTGRKSLKKFFELVLPAVMSPLRHIYFIFIFAAVHIVLSQTPNSNSLRGVSVLAAVMSLCYSMIAFVASTIKGSHHHPVSYGVRSHTTAGKILDSFNALAAVAFSFGHSVVLEIQATIPWSPEVPSKQPMWRGSLVAYAIVALCYFSVSISGFRAFGSLGDDDILISLEK